MVDPGKYLAFELPVLIDAPVIRLVQERMPVVAVHAQSAMRGDDEGVRIVRMRDADAGVRVRAR